MKGLVLKKLSFYLKSIADFIPKLWLIIIEMFQQIRKIITLKWDHKVQKGMQRLYKIKQDNLMSNAPQDVHKFFQN